MNSASCFSRAPLFSNGGPEVDVAVVERRFAAACLFSSDGRGMYTYLRRVWLSLSRNSVAAPAEPPRVPPRAIRQVCIHTSTVARKHARPAQGLLERATPT